MFTFYGYSKCSTCRDALKWLDAHKIAYQIKAIRETPPSIEELTTALSAFQGDKRRLFNTSGMDYRALGLKDRLPQMGDADALALLHSNGNLVKRPFLIGKGVVIAGFKPELWKNTLIG